MSAFNKNNHLGKYCCWAFIPGWYDINFTGTESASSTGDVAYAESVGQRQVFVDNYGSGPNSSVADTITKSFGHLGKVRALRLDQQSYASHAKLSRAPGDTGIQFKKDYDITIVSIVRLSGDGRPNGVGDPRIYSKDLGSGSADHDMMIGVATTGNDARTRMRLNGTTYTVLNAGVIEDNTLNLIAGHIYENSSGDFRAGVSHLGESGSFTRANASSGEPSGYDPRTTTGIAIGANYGASDNAFEGDIIGIWAFDKDLNETELRSLFANPWQVFAPRKILVPLKYSPIITAEETGPAIVEGSISFALQADKTFVNTLTAETAASFLVNLATAQDADTGSVEGSISFGLQAGQLQTVTATRPVTFSATIDLTQLESNTATRVEQALIALEMEQTQTNVKVVDGQLTFSTDLDYNTFNQLIAQVDTTIAANMSYDILAQMVADKSVNFGTVLSEFELNQLVAQAQATFGATLDYDAVYGALVVGSIEFGTTLDYNVLNQLIADASSTFNVEMDKVLLNQLIAQASVNINVGLDYNVLNRLIGNVTVPLNTTLNMLQVGDGAGEISVAITFLANMAQLQENRITGDRALSLVMNAASQYNVQLDKNEALELILQASDQYASSREFTESVTLATELDQTQSSSLDKVLLMTFNALMDKNISTAGSVFGPTIEFASVLASNFGTEGDVTGDITFTTDMGQSTSTRKITDVSMGFDVDASIITEIHLVAEGQISLSTIMNATEAQQMLGQAGITFGHINGLAALGSANLGADITMGIIQDVQIAGFTIQFEIVTPDSRTLRVYVEDRTIIVDGDTRVTTIFKT